MMSHYERRISEITGHTDIEIINEIEDIMRNDIFHSTLDWQSRQQFIEAAILAEKIRLDYVENGPKYEAKFMDKMKLPFKLFEE